MKTQKHQNNLPKLPKNEKTPIYRNYMLGKMKIFKLPTSYLSYLKRKFQFQVSSVSSGKIQVSTQTPMNKGFGKIGKIFCIILTLQTLLYCQNSEFRTDDNIITKENNTTASRAVNPSTGTFIDDGTGALLLPADPIVRPRTMYIRYNIQDDLFSINGGPWFTNPIYTNPGTGDTEPIFAFANPPCGVDFHSGIYKFLRVTPLNVPSGINLTMTIGTPDIIYLQNPNCTYWQNTDIIHFKVTYVPWYK